MHPSEEIIIELRTVGFAEIQGLKYVGFLVNENVHLQNFKQHVAGKKLTRSATSWDLEVNLYFNVEFSTPEVLIFTNRVTPKHEFVIKGSSVNS